MGILGRYVFRQTAGAVLLILLSLTGVTWIAVALRQVDLMTSQGQNAYEFLKLTALALPALMAFVAPLAVLIASLQVLNRLNGDSELIVMTAGGASTWRLLTPLLLLGLIFTLFVGGINHMVAPWASRALRERVAEVRTELVGQVIQPGRFTQPEPNLTLHIRDRRDDGALLGLLINDARDPKQISTYLAERGFLTQQGAAAYLIMHDGWILRQSSPTEAAEVIVFDRYAVDLNQLDQKVDTAIPLKPREMSYAELIAKEVPPAATGGNSRGRFLAELHDRSAAALYPLAFVLLALAFAGQAQTTRQSRNALLVGGFASAVGARLLGIGAANAVVIRPSALAFMYAVPLGACLISLLLVAKNLYPRPPNKFERGIGLVKARVSRVLLAPFRWAAAKWKVARTGASRQVATGAKRQRVRS